MHRMATDEEGRDVIIALIHKFFMDDSVTPADTQKRLADLFRTQNTNLRK